MLCLLSWTSFIPAQSVSTAAAIDSYLQPYVRSNNFSGAVFVEQNGRVLFEKAYGFADREHHIRNTPGTRFHIASMSMQFTAAAILRLVDTGSIHLEDTVGDLVPGIAGAEKITVRDLLIERSGLPDINALPGYEDVLQHHQTPATLVAQIGGHPLLFEPGSKFLHEEHSAYNLLALLIEKKSGLPFAAAMHHLVFQPLALNASGIDDDSTPQPSPMAKGYEPEKTSDLKPAHGIHWSAKTGNASVYSTASDEARWVDALFQGHPLSASSRDAVLDTSVGVGYGWFKGQNKRYADTTYYMNGRSPGFASFVLYFPQTRITVVVLSNIYSSATTTIGYDIAALTAGRSYKSFPLKETQPNADELKTCTGKFQFGPDFFQANAVIDIVSDGKELFLHWPSGDVSSLIVLDRDHFIDRSYWEDVKISRDSAGHPVTLSYDRFEGNVAKP